MENPAKTDETLPEATLEAAKAAEPPKAPAADVVTAAPKPARRKVFSGLRGEITVWKAVLLGAACVVLCGALWTGLTWGSQREDRIVAYSVLPSPGETFDDFKSLWFDHALTRNTLTSLRRVLLGFGLAALAGIPIGVLCGCFRGVNAFFAPLTVGGRNIPVAALIPLTMSLFGIYEFQKIMFIFIACIAFIIMDTATAVADVSSRYIDTAFTLGASRRQIIFKVLVPLAMPNIFNSLRLLFGLAFGYIMLAEVIQTSDVGGLGSIINIGQSRGGHKTYILLVLMLIPIVAFGIDRAIFWIQRQLFPYRYGGAGLLHHGIRALMAAWESFKHLFIAPAKLDAQALAPAPAAPQDGSKRGAAS